MAAHWSPAPSSAVSSVGSCNFFLHHLQEEDGPVVAPSKRNSKGQRNQLVFASHCVKHRKVTQAESCCRGQGFLACHGNLWKAIKIQQQTVSRCSLWWLCQLVCSHLASRAPFTESSPILDKVLMLSSLPSLKASSALQTRDQRKDQQQLVPFGASSTRSLTEPCPFCPVSGEQG